MDIHRTCQRRNVIALVPSRKRVWIRGRGYLTGFKSLQQKCELPSLWPRPLQRSGANGRTRHKKNTAEEVIYLVKSVSQSLSNRGQPMAWMLSHLPQSVQLRVKIIRIIFVDHCIPIRLTTDNEPQCSSVKLKLLKVTMG